MASRVSVVVSTFNRLELLQELLAALAVQTFKDFEVIVVDDGSRVAVAPALEAVKQPYPLMILTQANAGAAAARHAGIMQATGEIIVITDDDMLVPAAFLAEHIKAHDAGFTLVLGHIAYDESLGNKPLFERFHAQQLARFVERYTEHPTDVRGVMVCTGNVSFRRADYVAVGGFDKSLDRSEDRELGVRLQKAGATLTFAVAAKTTNRSDHTDLSVWRRRNFQYGIYDSRIFQKHPELADANPWHFVFLVNPVSRGLLLLSAAAPGVGEALSAAAYGLAQQLDRRRSLHPSFEKAAIAGATLSYGLDYFRGVRTEAGSLTRAAQGLLAHAVTLLAQKKTR
jgi:glycosyltransferase involved in cell wall biosynthesis